jgi:hypothetical protein
MGCGIIEAGVGLENNAFSQFGTPVAPYKNRPTPGGSEKLFKAQLVPLTGFLRLSCVKYGVWRESDPAVIRTRNIFSADN